MSNSEPKIVQEGDLEPPHSHSPGKTSGTSHFVEHHAHYYPDGNIILLAGQTKFRVLRSILARKSVFFRDMFNTIPDTSSSNPDQDKGQNMIDGIAAVELHDSEEDVERLLDAIFPSSRFAPRPSTDVIHSVLRLSDKYQFDIVYEETAVAALQPFPRTLKEFQEDPDLICYDSVVKAVGAIRLARLTGDCTVLPLAFYALMIQDWPGDDDLAAKEISKSLTYTDYSRLQNGRYALALVLAEGLDSIRAKGKCSSQGIQHSQRGWIACPLQNQRPGPLSSFVSHPLGEVWKKSSGKDVCPPCQEILVGSMPKLLLTLFNVLQTHFAKP